MTSRVAEFWSLWNSKHDDPRRESAANRAKVAVVTTLSFSLVCTGIARVFSMGRVLPNFVGILIGSGLASATEVVAPKSRGKRRHYLVVTVALLLDLAFLAWLFGAFGPKPSFFS